MLNLETSSTWELVKDKLLDMQKNSVEGLQKLANTREEDVAYKAKLAVIKELLNLPRTLATKDAAKHQRVYE